MVGFQDGVYTPVTDSSTGDVIAEVPCCTASEVEAAIASAQAAFILVDVVAV